MVSNLVLKPVLEKFPIFFLFLHPSLAFLLTRRQQ